MQNISFSGVGERVILCVEGACFKDTLRSSFHECDVFAMDEIVVDYRHTFHRRIEMMFLDMLIAYTIFQCFEGF
jgi:hypothetical protein